MATEDAVINAVAQTGTFKNKISNLDTGLYAQSATVSVPATNCVPLGGNGPIKVVFARGESWNSTVSDFVSKSLNVINNGYGKIDPFKKYFSQFSFYADLKKYPDALGVGVQGIVPVVIQSDGTKSAFSAVTSCAALGHIDTTIFFESDTLDGNSAFAYLGTGNVFYNIYAANQTNLIGRFSAGSGLDRASTEAGVIIHEVGHAFAGLLDEYVSQTQNNKDNLLTGVNNPRILTTENCSTYPARDFRNPADGRLYGAYLDKGCEYLVAQLQSGQKHPLPYYRPAVRSIMSSGDLTTNTDTIWVPKFNIISCGYIIAAIKNQSLSQANAGSHWAECAGLDTAGKTEIPPVTVAPTVNSVTPVSGAANTFNISGPTVPGYIKLNPAPSAFVPGSNNGANVYTGIQMWKEFFKKFIPIVHGQTVSASYEIDTVTSVNASTISFTVPSYVPDGTYTVSVSNPNSPWTDTPYTITVSGNGTGDPTTAIGTSGTIGDTTPINGGSTGPTVPSYTCPTGYTLQSGNTCYKAPTAATLSYYCPSGGTYIYGTLNGVVGHYCNTGYSQYNATSYNTCPSGATLSGTQCSYATVNATPICSTSGYTLNSTKTACVLSSVSGITCPSGYTLQTNNTCTTTAAVTKVITNADGTKYYVCSIGYVLDPVYVNNQLSGGTCVKTVDAKGVITVSITDVATTSIRITWTDAMNKSPYTIRTAVGSTNIVATVSSKEYTQTNLVPGTSHCYVVYDSTGTNYSNALCRTTVPISVQTPVLSATAPVKGVVSLSWAKVDDGTGLYSLERAKGSTDPFLVVAEMLPGTTSYMDKTVAPSTSYRYKLTYKTASGVARTSVVVSVTTLAKPATPVVKIASTTSDRIIVTLSDTDATSITGYGLSQTTPGVKSIFDKVLVTTYTVGNLSPLTKYCFASVAYANMIRSATSSAICATTLKAPVISVQTTTVTANTSTVIATTSVTAPITAPVTDQSSVPVPAPITSSIPATLTYTCQSGIVPVNNQCTSKVLSTTGGVSANKTYTCPTGYAKINASLCKDRTTLATTTTTLVYTCGSARTLNVFDSKCYTTTQVTSPAIQNYSCPTGYTLNAADNTCALIVSREFSTSTTTASVFDALASFFRSLFR